MENRLDLKHIPKELLLIMDLLKDNDDRQISEVRFFDLDWNRFIDLAIHHRVYSLLYLQLKQIESDAIPSTVRKQLAYLYRKNTIKMLFLSAEMQEVSKLFKIHQIRTLFLKGPVLAQTLYGDISLRTSRDLDILIPIEQLDQAEELLFKRGYQKEYEINKALNEWKWRHRHVNYYHPDKQITIEIHWRLNTGPAKEPRFNELWNRRQDVPSIHDVNMLSDEDLYWYLNTHGSQHGWSRLRWLVDIKQLIHRDLDWGKVSQRLKQYGYFHVGGQGLVLVSELLNGKISNEAASHLINRRSKKLAIKSIFYLESMINIHSLPLPEAVVKYHKRYLIELMSLEQRVLFTLSFLYPYPDDVKTLPLPKSLHFLYFPLRPFLWAWRKTRKHALS
ncbi:MULTISPECIES: nucleotidyltransferase domain-containing protein [Gracilibacillus]|uniref:nucleotidyltransferase domain-containing protein n=1 Tax=Gracilibacillus TaxID=74385 RepID=UPI0008262349|nr:MULTISPECIES: nucleotidyltransferase family protein [Gracilibacillus]